MDMKKSEIILEERGLLKKRFFCAIIFFFFLLTYCLPSTVADEAPPSLVITNARLIDGTGKPPVSSAVIIITGDKFVAVGHKGKVKIPAEAEIIDVGGKTVIPGLIDAHVHFTIPPSLEEHFVDNDSIASFRSVHFLHQLLMVGVTTVRDVISRHEVGIMAKKAFRNGYFLGSRPIVVGMGITCTGGHGAEHGTSQVMELNGADEFRRGVRTQLRKGADLIKVLPPYSQEEITAAVEETHGWGKFLTVHSGRSGFMKGENYDYNRWAVQAGADCIEHAYAIPEDSISLMAEKGTYCVPTVTILLKIAEKFLEKNPGQEKKMAGFLESPEIFKKLKNAGVKMAVGTDAVLEYMSLYPWIYFEEVERFVELGCTPMEAIVAATRTGAEVCDAADKLGTVEKGKIADILVLGADPLADIRALRRCEIIIQEGKIIKK